MAWLRFMGNQELIYKPLFRSYRLMRVWSVRLKSASFDALFNVWVFIYTNVRVVLVL